MRSCSVFVPEIALGDLEVDWATLAGVQAYSLREGLLSSRRLDNHCGRDDNDILAWVDARMSRGDDEKGRRALDHVAIGVVYVRLWWCICCRCGMRLCEIGLWTPVIWGKLRSCDWKGSDAELV